MEENVGALAMERDIGRRSGSDRVRRSCDVLFLLVLGVGLSGLCLDRCLFAQVGVWHRDLRVIDRLQVFLADVLDLHLLAGNWIGDIFDVLGRLGILLVRLDGLVLCLSLSLCSLICSGISLLLVLVEVGNKGLDVGDLVLPTVVATRGMLQSVSVLVFSRGLYERLYAHSRFVRS